MESFLHKAGIPSNRNTGLYTTKMLSGIFYPSKRGEYGNVRVSNYKTPAKITKMLKAASESGLVTCVDWNSHWSTDPEHHDAEARQYIPSWSLCETDLSMNRIYADGDDRLRDLKSTTGRQKPRFEAHSKAGVSIPDSVMKNLLDGTKLEFSHEDWMNDMKSLSGDEGVRKFLKKNRSMYFYKGEYRPSWGQKKCGRIYANSPYIQGLPKENRQFLRHIHGMPLFDVDWAQQELRILCALAGVTVSADDLYMIMSKGNREEAKEFVLPILYGRTENRITRNPDYQLDCGYGLTDEGENVLETHRQYEATMDAMGILAPLKALRNTDKHKIRRMGADMLYQALDRCYTNLGIHGGIPMHDGFLFPAPNTSILDDVKQIFVDASKDVIGVEISVNDKEI